MTVGAATMASRVLGFVRDAMIAGTLGTGIAADAFLVAFRLPNLFRRLFAEGSFNSAFVPLYARALAEDGEDGARRFAEEAFAVLLVTVGVVTALAMVAAPLFVLLLAPGFADTPEKFGLAARLTRYCFPYLAAMSVIGLLAGILNAHRRFLAAALAPVLLNVVLIAVLVGVEVAGLGRSPEAATALALGVAAAGFAQLAMVGLAVRRAGWAPRLRLPRVTPGVRRLVALGLPGLVAGGITQINIVIGTVIASLQDGSVAILYYADRLYQLPLGIVGIAIGVVLLPEIARQVRAEREDLVLEAQNRSVEFALILTLPAALALMLASKPIVEVLFERGAFGPQDTMETAETLSAFACGLPAFVLIKVLSPAFFAREDTRTPMLIGGVAVLANVVAALTLWPALQHVGIAIATSLAGWLNAGLLWLVLVRRGQWRTDGELETRLPRIAGAAAAMGAAVFLVAAWLEPWTGAENPLLVKGAALGALVLSGIAVFFGVAQAIGAVDLRLVRQLLRRDPDAGSERALTAAASE